MMDVLTAHTAVIDEPAPTVLVDSLGSSTVKLRCQYWLDQEKHAPGKVTSSLIRQVIQQLNKNGISLPDEARELVFPRGVPVKFVKEEATTTADVETSFGETGIADAKSNKVNAAESTEAEGDLSSDRAEIERVTEDEGAVADETNLLKPKLQ
jgi:small conductance mechanosensitive channel